MSKRTGEPDNAPVSRYRGMGFIPHCNMVMSDGLYVG
jgi:hypothetical protein